jgi:hypothetical protein
MLSALYKAVSRRDAALLAFHEKTQLFAPAIMFIMAAARHGRNIELVPPSETLTDKNFWRSTTRPLNITKSSQLRSE